MGSARDKPVRNRIGLREVRALAPGEQIWDSTVIGFGARRQSGPIVSYVLAYRTKDGRSRWYTIGKHGSPWTPEKARDKARELLVEVVRGGDPAGKKRDERQAQTVAELCDVYLSAAESGRLLTRVKRPKKTSTLVSDRSRIESHIKPLIGRLSVAGVTSSDIEKFMHAVADRESVGKPSRRGGRARGGQGTASRTVGLLGGIFTFAVRRHMRPDNPVHGVMRPADGRRDRRLADHEYARLGAALRQAEAESFWPAAIACTRFLALTGWRSGEALTLRWRDVDLARRTATLPDSKTGRSVRALGKPACNVLRALGRAAEDALVFPATRGSGSMTGYRKFFGRQLVLGGLPGDITPHTLRHSYASLAGDLGLSELTIAGLIGHRGQSITSRYVHAAAEVLLVAADVVAAETAKRMGDAQPAGQVMALRETG